MARWEPWGGCVVVSVMEDKTPQMPWGGCVVVSMVEDTSNAMRRLCSCLNGGRQDTLNASRWVCSCLQGGGQDTPNASRWMRSCLWDGWLGVPHLSNWQMAGSWDEATAPLHTAPNLNCLTTSDLPHFFTWISFCECSCFPASIYILPALPPATPPPKKNPYAHAVSLAIQAAAHQLQGLFGFEVQEATVQTEGGRGRQGTIPFWRGMGVFSRNCVCFQWVLALAGPVLKWTWRHKHNC